jgi:cytochrome c oxidase assembly protein subunit 15
LFNHVPAWLAPFEDVTTVQFNHRMMAYVVCAAVLALWIAGRRQGLPRPADTTSNLLLAATVAQILLGIWTLVEVVPVALGALHQLGAVVLLTAALLHAFTLRRAGLATPAG